jgi:hypothetical protein
MLPPDHFSFLIDKYMAEETTTESVDEMLQSLQLLLLRVRIILEEANGRSITSQAMLQQLNILRKEMYRGYYVLDSFRGNQANQDDAKGQNSVRPSFTLSKFSPAKRLFLSATSVAGTGGTCTPCMSVKEVQQVSKNLGTIIFHMSEFLAFLKNYPLRYRQPYFMHLMIGLSLFGRQMEMERVMNFLMQTEPSTGESTGVVPITGPAGVGKSTLVAHVYNSEKVREHFSRVVLVTHEDLKNRRLATLKDGGLIIHRNNPSPNGNGRLLVIIELLEDVVEEDTWKRWYASSAACLESGSKIIITSRSSKIQKFGITQALVLNVLPIDACWYFFKVLTFGSADPEDQPKLESVALEIARKMNGSFTATHVISSLLRRNFTARYWLRILTYVNKYPNNYVMQEQKPQYYLRIVSDKTTYFVFYGVYQTNFQHGHVDPKIKLHDVLFGCVQCQRRSEVLAWKSHIPPYGSYIYSCAISKSSEIKRQNHRANTDQAKRKKVTT